MNGDLVVHNYFYIIKLVLTGTEKSHRYLEIETVNWFLLIIYINVHSHNTFLAVI